MRIGLIARPDSRGLGIQTKAFHDQMHPVKTLVIDPPSQQPLPIRKDWYPDAHWVHGLPGAPDLDKFLQDLDAVYTAETGYGDLLWEMAQRRGIKTVLHANYEFLNRKDTPTVWAAPSMWHIDKWPSGTIYLPVPIEIDRFNEPEKPSTARRFLHIVGRPTMDRKHDLNRNGTVDVFESLRHVNADIEITFRCQQPGYVESLAAQAHIPNNVAVRIQSGDKRNYWDNYTGFDCLILPRRFGGLCLPVNEALGAGMPVIMTDISPNNCWLPREWLAASGFAGDFTAKQRITCYKADPRALATIITNMTDPGFYKAATGKANRLRDKLSWKTLKPRYEEVFS
jgi:glycosyltransferase involved in cell wall biosynthesis